MHDNYLYHLLFRFKVHLFEVKNDKRKKKKNPSG